ncbi:MAG: CBS domain-containing protein [Deltaproteobacteria bacterium]|nr:CBS domain-containing protein [Deltaproteobacteria bacterium]
MTIENIMLKSVGTVLPDTPFSDLLSTHLKSESRQLYVVDEKGRLLGVLSNYDLLKLIAPDYLDSNLARSLHEDGRFFGDFIEKMKNKTAKDLMVKEFVAVKPGETVLEASILIREKRFFALPVVDENNILLGEVARSQILAHVARACGIS